LREQVMAENLHRVVAEILEADDPPHGILIDGDLALHDGRPGDYATLLQETDPLRRAGIPLHCALGNHDHRDHFRAAVNPAEPLVANKQVGVVEGPGVRLLLLDSLQRTNVTGGRLGMAQLEWLGRQLEAHPETPAVIFVHHNLNPEWPSALLDTRVLLELLRPRRQAKAVVFGHTHVWNVQAIDDIAMINLPAVGYRFLPKQPLGWCIFRPYSDGAEIELRCIGGDRRQHGRQVELRWRTA
jgi:3',5'-cyclic AMP phosphodiesterase CpdA